jgi:ubiquinone/menaquinone biosynthesis C-methylase UbiE
MAKNGNSKKYRYLLGDSTRERRRLQAQAQLWDPVTHALFDRVGVKPGWRVLEIGPGQGSLHLELRKRVKGPVDAVERSEIFAQRLQRKCKKDGLGQGQIWNEEIQEVNLPHDTYDLIFLRWVMLFLPNPATVIEKLARALKPGGILAIQDYYRDTLALLPLPHDWQDFMAADHAFFSSEGGNANIGGILPHYFQQSQLKLVELKATIKQGHPGSVEWNWLSDFFLGVLDQYSKLKPFSKAKANALRASWESARKNKSSLLIAPTVLDVVGKKIGSSRRSS